MSQSFSSRTMATQLVFQVLVQGRSLSHLLSTLAPHYSSKDVALIQEIGFGVCRVLPRLTQIITLLVPKPLTGKKRMVHCVLLVGLYQLLYLRVPSHAAVDEAVKACGELQLTDFRALVNGVLRRFLREQTAILVKVDQHWQTLHPEWIVNRLKKAYPYPHWREIVEQNNHKPPMWIRVNCQHSTPQQYAQLLVQSEHWQAPLSSASAPDCALKLSSPLSVNALPHFKQGWVTVQDGHAQWAGKLLEPQNGETILDACAAPGGKTTHILELAPQAKVIALDIEPDRLVRVKQNLARLNQQATVICGDASNPAQCLPAGILFDKILLDAPCSATGVIRRHPDIKWLRQESDIATLVALQAEILTQLWRYLKPNGKLIYATCSILPEENSQQITHFLGTHGDAQRGMMQFNDEWVSEKQFFPEQYGGDGFFYACLIKRENYHV